MERFPTQSQIDKSKTSPWDFGNNILYKMCRDNFTHDKESCVLTKVLFIGRIYAAAIERRKNKKKDINDNFYVDTVSPTFIKSKLDQHLKCIKSNKKLTVNNLQSILETHGYLTTTLKRITYLDKRSFSSKYLHFHLPNLFFIYDSRVVKALRQFQSNVPKDLYYLTQLKNVDIEYAKFCCKCFDLKRKIEKRYKTNLTNRQFDNILISVANKNSK